VAARGAVESAMIDGTLITDSSVIERPAGAPVRVCSRPIRGRVYARGLAGATFPRRALRLPMRRGRASLRNVFLHNGLCA
jgi:hypothetical protein